MKRYERMKQRERQLKAAKDQAEHVCGRIIRLKTKVVGLRHRKSQVAAILAENNGSRFPILLQRRHDHQPDPNAIAVMVDRNADDCRDPAVESEEVNLLGYLPASFCILLSPLLDTNSLFIHSISLNELDPSLKALPTSLGVDIEACGSISDDVQCTLEEAALGDLSRQHFTQVIRRAQTLLASTDLIIEEVQSASLYTSLSYEAQTLFIKLLQRKSNWFVYSDEISRCSLDPLLEVSSMIADHTIVLDRRRELLASLLLALTAPELRALYKRCVNNSNGKGDKSEILKKLMHYLFNQRCIDGSPYFSSRLFTKNLQECCAKRCRLSPVHVQALVRLYRLETLNFGPDLLSMERLSNLKLIKFVPTSLSSEKPFSTRQQFLDLESALELISACETFLNDKNYASAIKFIPVARSKLSNIGELNAPLFWLQFHPGAMYCSVMYLSIKALQKLQHYEDAVNELMFLLNDVDPALLSGRRRGKCWSRMLLIIDVHLKQRELALSLCALALNDSAVDSGSKVALQDRVLRLLRKETDLIFPDYLSAVSLPANVPIEVIVGRPLNCKTAERSRFFGYDDEVVSVEELALQHFAKEGWQGFHDEGSLLFTLFGLLMWDIIWRQDIPNVFMASCQDAPLDLGTCLFYTSRQMDIEKRLQHIQCDMDFEKELSEVWNNHYGEFCRGVAWDRWTLDLLILLCSCIERAPIAAVFRLLAMNYSAWTGGLPDLAIYHSERKLFRFVEVKGPNDRLSEQQRAWLSRLHRFGFDASVLKVKPPNKRSKVTCDDTE